jgi:hypothetical protein
MDKRGFIRTLEAVIAVIALFGFIFYMNSQVNVVDNEVPFVVQNMHNFIFEELGYNQEYRDCVMNDFTVGKCSRPNDVPGEDWSCMEQLNDFIEANVPDGFEAECEVCRSSMSCLGDVLPIDRNIYANSLFISGNDPKIIRIYFWGKQP